MSQVKTPGGERGKREERREGEGRGGREEGK